MGKVNENNCLKYKTKPPAPKWEQAVIQGLLIALLLLPTGRRPIWLFLFSLLHWRRRWSGRRYVLGLRLNRSWGRRRRSSRRHICRPWFSGWRSRWWAIGRLDILKPDGPRRNHYRFLPTLGQIGSGFVHPFAGSGLADHRCRWRSFFGHGGLGGCPSCLWRGKAPIHRLGA